MPYHFQHFAHNSLSLYTPGGFAYLQNYNRDTLDPDPPSPRTHLPTFSPLHEGSTGDDDFLNHNALVTDSVLPYVKYDIAPFSPPPHSQESGLQGPGGAPGGGGAQVDDHHRREFESGRVDYTECDRFENIQQHIDSILRGE